ncbi:hypothetical protein [Microbacterium sp. Root166]|uniref:hypothetical protein n=1 Tax=Microbacterium sp. Root166 TaxID=1736478 RepID=UPI000AB875DB|nr:hypothetical protein [Microbacterium sp. Root166]
MRVGLDCGCEWRKGDMVRFSGMQCTLDRSQHPPEKDIAFAMSLRCKTCTENPELFEGYDPRRRKAAEAAYRTSQRAKASGGDNIKMILGLVVAMIVSFAVFSSCGSGGFG